MSLERVSALEEELTAANQEVRFVFGVVYLTHSAICAELCISAQSAKSLLQVSPRIILCRLVAQTHY